MLTIISSIIVFLIVVFIHELGHFLIAIKSDIKVNEFSLGMGPKIIQKTKKGIKYSIRSLPIGGYVSIEGENDESTDPRAFSNAKPYKRLAVIIAGVIMNFILGFLILVIINLFSQPVIAGFSQDSPAEEAGVQLGDVILKIDNNKIRFREDVSKYISKSQGEYIVFTLRSGSSIKEIDIKPKNIENNKYVVGISIGKDFSRQNLSNFSLLKGLKGGTNDFIFYSTIIFQAFSKLITGRMGLSNISGPIGVVKAIGDSAKNGFLSFFNFIAILSINLGIFNIMPFPALDGGRAVLIIIEMFTKKRLPIEKEGLLNLVGLIVLLLLMMAVTFKDIITLF